MFSGILGVQDWGIVTFRARTIDHIMSGGPLAQKWGLGRREARGGTVLVAQLGFERKEPSGGRRLGPAIWKAEVET